ncbi:MAG: ribbon-helix-helix domain-containing protein [Candidatus Nezhaarchaeales archaeon]
MGKRIDKRKMILITVHLPEAYDFALKELVKKGVFPSRSEAIRIAVRDLLVKIKERERNLQGVMIG